MPETNFPGFAEANSESARSGRAVVTDKTSLTLDQAVALARYATDRSDLADIVARLPANLKEEGQAAVERVAPLADDPETEAILRNQSAGLAEHLFREADTEGVAARLLDWAAQYKWLRGVSRQTAVLAKRFPDALTPERIERLARACLTSGVGDFEPDVLVILLLEKNAFNSADLLTLYKQIPDDSKLTRRLIVHEHATPELWATVARGARQSGSSAGSTHEIYLRELDDIDALMSHSPAMAVPEVGDILLGRRDLANAFGMTEYLRRLTRMLPSGFALEHGHASRIIEELFSADIVSALRTIEHLPDEWRSCVPRDRIVDLAASHPDGQVRQAAILFSANVGEEVELIHRKAAQQM